jgi:tetratricopeptide (TPR) repeat protein
MKTTLLFVVVGVLVLGCAKQAEYITTDSEEARVLYKSAESKMENAMVADALPDLEEAVKLDPEFALAWSRLSTVYDFLGETEKAEEALENAKKYQEEATGYEQMRIAIRDAQMPYDEEAVLSRSKAMVEAFPKDARAYFILGNYYFSQAEYENAVETLGKTVELDKNFAPAYNILGYAQANLGKFEAAKYALEKYADLLPDELNPHDSYGEILMHTGEYDEALAEFQKAYEIDPEVQFVLQHIALALAAQGRYAEAMEYLQKAVDAAASKPARGDAHFTMGVISLEMGRFDRALTEAELCSELDPERPCPHETRLRAFIHKDQLKKADKELETMEGLMAEYTDPMRWMLGPQALLAAARNEYDSAIEKLNAAVEKAGTFERIGHLSDLAKVYFEQGDYENTVTTVGKINEVNPNHFKMRLLAGKAYEEVGEPENAIAEYEKALEILVRADEGVPEVTEAKDRLKALGTL